MRKVKEILSPKYNCNLGKFPRYWPGFCLILYLDHDPGSEPAFLSVELFWMLFYVTKP